MNSVFSKHELEDFYRTGAIRLRNGIPQEVVREARRAIWDVVGADPNDRQTWPEESFVVECIDPSVMPRIFTPRTCQGVDELLGPGRWCRNLGLRNHPMRYPTPNAQWQWPEDGWHVDSAGGRHSLYGTTQALVFLPVWSDIGPQAGGTVIKAGSHKVAARMLMELDDDGIGNGALDRVILGLGIDFPLIELTANAGDILILHRLTMHAASTNCSDHVRMISNSSITLLEPPCYNRPNPEDYSVFERSMLMACTEHWGQLPHPVPSTTHPLATAETRPSQASVC